MRAKRTVYFLGLVTLIGAGCPTTEKENPASPKPKVEVKQAGIDAGGTEIITPTPKDGGTPPESTTDGGLGPPLGQFTYYEHVAPILAKNCVSCHSQGGIRAQTPLDEYDAVAPLASTIKFYTSNRLMPPWYTDNSGACGSYRDPLWLTDNEIDILATWAEEGAAAGAVVAPPDPPSLPFLEEPTTTVEMAQPYLPSVEDSFEQDDYRCFILDPQLPTDQFLTGFEVLPGNLNVVHHVLLYRLNSSAAEAAASEKDNADPGEGYTCFGGPGLAGSFYDLIGGWAPGAGAVIFPDNSGVKLLANRKMVIQVHYNLENGAESDQTALKMKLSPTVEKEGYVRIFNDLSLSLAPGQSDVSHSFTVALDEWTAGNTQINLWGLVPHMHKRGLSIKTEKVSGQVADTCINNIPYWDFNWQWFYFFEESVPLVAGDQLRVTCRFDTSSDSTQVNFGEGTSDEMCVLVVYGTLTPQ